MGNLAGGRLGVPLRWHSPAPELDYLIGDSDASIVVADESHAALLEPIADAAVAPHSSRPASLLAPSNRPSAHLCLTVPIDGSRTARTMVYTSGTTGKPKGVVTTHANITAQIESLIAAWEWTAEDRTLLVLPLHHVHGIINVVGMRAVERRRAARSCRASTRRPPGIALRRATLTVFTAVPTIYHRLIQSWDAARAGRSAGAIQRLPSAAIDDVGFRRASPPGSRPMEGNHRPRPARALRHDRSGHGAVESASWRAASRIRRLARSPASRCVSWTIGISRCPTANLAKSQLKGTGSLFRILAAARKHP